MEDFLYKYLKIFYNLPWPVKRLVGCLYKLLPKRMKYGSFYFAYINRIRLFNSLNYEAACKEQQKILLNQVNDAISHVPYYSHYKRCTSMEDFTELPVIDKQVIVRSFHDFTNPGTRNSRIKANTGGSSGTPLEFFIEKDISRPKEKAHFDWYWGLFNYKSNDRIMMIRGLPLSQNRLFEYRTIDNVLNITCYKLNNQNISQIAREIETFRPTIIHGYPSSLKILTVLLETITFKNKPKIKAIFLGSESLTDSDRQYFKEFYNAKVVNWYGHTERLIHGGNCPAANGYHFYPFYGYMELLDEWNNPVREPGKEGRIVATGFDNRVMPFIRYDTGDLGILSENKTCECGFTGTTLKSITGRSQYIIVLSDNTSVSLTAFIFGQHLDAFKRIMEMQIVQERIGEIEIKIIKSPEYSSADEDSLAQTLLSSVDHKIKIKFTYVDELTKTVRGKNIFFISRLN